MTAPGIVSIIAKVIADNSITFNDSRDYGLLTASTSTPEEMARAVLAAISEAGQVEWGVQWEVGHSSQWTVPYDDKDQASEVLAGSVSIGTLVSRITGPGTAVEG